MRFKLTAKLALAALLVGVTGCNDSASTDGNDTAVKSEPGANAVAGSSDAAADAIDRTDPLDTAKAVLQAYQAKDFGKLAELSTEINQKIFTELAAQGEEHPRYSSINQGWRAEAVAAWQGEVGPVRYRARDAAAVQFGEMGPDELAVVSLEWAGDGWAFDDVHSPARADFEAASEQRPE